MHFISGRVGIIKCAAVADVWPIISGWIESCLKVAPPWWTLESIRRRCESGEYVIWLVLLDNKPCAVALSQLEQFDTALICNVPWIGGRGMRHWLPFLQEIIESWAKDAGATHLSGAGRRGWSRMAGMKEIGTILAKEL